MSGWKEYRELLAMFRSRGDIRVLADALDKVPSLVREVVRGELADVRARLSEIAASLSDLRGVVEDLAGRVMELETRYSEMNRRLSGLEPVIGGLAEALLSRIVTEELESKGYRIRAKYRNYRVDNEDIDLLVLAEKNGAQEHFIVEVKVKPSHSDVGALLAKADLYEARTGTKPRPILAGVWIGSEVESYAAKKNVLVIKL